MTADLAALACACMVQYSATAVDVATVDCLLEDQSTTAQYHAVHVQ